MTTHADQPLGESGGQARTDGQATSNANDSTTGRDRQSSTDDDAELLKVLDGEVIPPGEGEEGDPDALDLVEVEDDDGKKHKIPKSLHGGFMKNADYTQKTQRLSEGTRQLETRTTQFNERVQAAEKTITQRSTLVYLDEQLKQLGNVDWQKLSAENPTEAQRLDFIRRDLAQQRHTLANEIQGAEDKFIREQRADFAKRQDETRRTNERDIPGWTTKRDAEMVTKAAQFYGLTMEQMLPASADPVLYRILWDAVQMKSLLEKRANQPKPKTTETPEPQPAAKVQGGRAPGKAGPQDNQSIDDWMKGRDREIAERKRRSG